VVIFKYMKQISNFFQVLHRRSFWAFILLFLLIIVPVWIFSIRAEQKRAQLRAQDSERWLELLGSENPIYRDDQVGGGTPAETVSLLANAFSVGEIAQIQGYFISTPDGSREGWIPLLNHIDSQGGFPIMAAYLEVAQPEPDGISDDYFYEYIARDAKGEALLKIRFIYNESVWKVYEIYK